MKKSNYRKPRRTYKRKVIRKNNMNVLVSSRKLFVLAPRMKTHLKLSTTAYAGAGAIPAAGSYFVSYANALDQPNNASPPWTSTFLTSQGSTTAQSPIGYTALSGLYTRYRINKVHYKLTWTTQDNGDDYTVYIYPFIWQNGGASLNPWNGLSQPGSKGKTIGGWAGSNSKDNVIRNTIDVQKVLGMTSTQYKSQPDTTIGTAPSNSILVGVNFSFESPTNDVNFDDCSFVLEATYEVEFSCPKPQTN